MEKYGVDKQIQHTGLRNEEARLMQRMQMEMSKTAEERNIEELEDRLQEVRSKLTELDLGTSSLE
jgi:hypothetical protein